MNVVIIFGNDHTNTLGVIQSLGRISIKRIAFVWGSKTGLVKSSRFTDEIYAYANEQTCVDEMIAMFRHQESRIPIIPCSDSAALALDANRLKLEKDFVFGYVTGDYQFPDLFKKEIQVNLAKYSGFNVPKSWIWDGQVTPEDLFFPCIIKPLVSCKGAKSDIRICYNEEDLKNNFRSLSFTKEVILQQYIDHDYEISILGCGNKDGGCFIPVVEEKLTLYPKYVGLECLSYIKELRDTDIINSIANIISKIGYVGLFSVEMMHSKVDDKFYFTEINLRNDGANAMIYKYGVNLPLHYIREVLSQPKQESIKTDEGYYIWDMHHFLSLLHGELPLRKWLSEIMKCKGFMTYFSDDIKPFYKQYLYWLFRVLHIKKDEKYA